LPKKILLIVFVISLSSLISSCGITPPKVNLCTEISFSKGYCINTVKDIEFEVSDSKPWNGKTWWELRPTMIYMPAESWSEIKSFIIKICKRTGKCNQSVSNWERTVKTVDDKIIKKIKSK